ncbi:hypothetical protein [Cryptosporangium phraense]|uniref:Phytanoyl-CoA dioxygenase family protein n=1 Tax=Cryptosporangium phraense TaxID=2593070 RepID=A0A545AZY5_9ACTN|nr:hypothetical protein [Cryptosporangium phraense]TQS46869.1 hypothetical protein FL583_00905 [Cryptosporangium phraense]
MRSVLATLAPADVRRFDRDGYVVVKRAFLPADGLAMQRRWWRELKERHGFDVDDRSGWRPFAGDLRAAKRDPIQARILTGRVRGVVDDLLGKGAWRTPRDWGRCLVTFPEPGVWQVPTRLWHWDNPCDLHLDGPKGLFVVSFVSSVGPGCGGTLLLSGSHRLLLQQAAGSSADQRRGSGMTHWERFHRSHPWLRALTGHAPSPADRSAAFMTGETLVGGVPLRVVELTGEPGDMVFCHPAIVHCAAPNRGVRPRFMRIKNEILTHEGRELRRRLNAVAHY